LRMQIPAVAIVGSIDAIIPMQARRADVPGVDLHSSAVDPAMLEWLVNTIVADTNTRNEDRIVGFSIDPPNALYSSPKTESRIV
jgi:hypothetical protein